MSAQPAPTQPFDPITLPGATILSIGADLLEEETHLHNERLPNTTAAMLEQALRQRDLDNYRLGVERGFTQGMCISMVAWVIVSLVSSCFGEYEAIVKGLMVGLYIWVFAQTY
jgi:hypothetical protein